MRPRSTYRLQFSPSFTIPDATRIVPYLHVLGVTHVYASPLLGSRRGSPHGYDVTDADHIDAELGGAAAFAALVDALRERDMGLLLDIVPNHMAASVENRWWRDVLQHGRASPYAEHFDIDWEPARPGMQNKVLLPMLEAQYGRLLEEGKLRLELTPRGLTVRYHDTRLPIDPRGHAAVLRDGIERLAERLGSDHRAVRGVLRLADAFQHHDRATGTVDGLVGELAELCEREPEARLYLDGVIGEWNGRAGDPASFDRLDHLLDAQHYRLAYWPVANQEINYRRFFDISDLVSLRIDDTSVFADTHRLVLRLVADGAISGLRVDHVDGLRDPRAYLDQLRGRSGPGSYLIVEKILAPGEALPDAWPVDGTTGYEFLDQAGRLAVDGAGLAKLGDLYRQWTGETRDFAEIAYEQQRRALTELFGGELRNLSARLGRLAETHRHGRDLTLTELGRALVGVTASLPVYRTYIRDVSIPETARSVLQRAVDDAVRRDPAISAAAEFLRHAFQLEMPAHLSAVQREAWLRFVTSWQQLTGAVMAKGVEDSAFYRWSRLVSRNEVGSDPAGAGLSVDAFHDLMARRQERWPGSLSATSTHDTKRSEDVRSRIDVLTQVSDAWRASLERWRTRNAEVAEPLDADMRLLLLQTLVGAAPDDEAERPAFAERLAEYARKAAREAKRRTSWLAPDERYEDVLASFTRRLALAEPGDPLTQDLAPIRRVAAYHGSLGSLAQLVVKLAAPGVPDIYQGAELIDLSLVDPDNRRPVDFAARAAALAALDGTRDRPVLARELLAEGDFARLKLLVTAAGLRLRRARPDVFSGAYVPVEARGARRDHVCAFARGSGGTWVLAVVAVRTAQLVERTGELPVCRAPTGADWEQMDLDLPPGSPRGWRCVLTGRTLTALPALALRDVFRDLPFALLESA